MFTGLGKMAQDKDRKIANFRRQYLKKKSATFLDWSVDLGRGSVEVRVIWSVDLECGSGVLTWSVDLEC